MKSKTVIATCVMMFCIGAGLIAWLLSPVEHLADGQSSASFFIECDFDKFRQIMVRKNATAVIVEQTGMKLLDERIDDVQLEVNEGDRPLLDAIRGKWKSDMTAIKELVVELTDPALDAKELILRQQANMQSESMEVATKSKSPAGNLRSYATSLNAKKSGERTEVSIDVALTVLTNVPSLFTGQADKQVQQAADEAVSSQTEAMKAFVARHADRRLILPEFGN